MAAIYSTFAGPGHFLTLRALDSEFANANHRALADLLKSGRVRAIITTNFDTLIERACKEADVALRVVLPVDAGGVGSVEPCLYKIHGSVADASLMIDTVGQKIRGIPIAMRAVLETLFREYHCERVLQSMSAGVVPSDASFAGVDDRIDVIRRRDRLVREASVAATPDFLLSLPIARDQHSAYRVNLLKAGFAGDHDRAAACPVGLAQAKFNERQF